MRKFWFFLLWWCVHEHYHAAKKKADGDDNGSDADCSSKSLCSNGRTEGEETYERATLGSCRVSHRRTAKYKTFD